METRAYHRLAFEIDLRQRIIWKSVSWVTSRTALLEIRKLNAHDVDSGKPTAVFCIEAGMDLSQLVRRYCGALKALSYSKST